MNLDQEVEALKRIKMFANIEASKLKLLAFASERVIFEPGEKLFSQGDMADAAYIVLEGHADIIIGPKDQQIKVHECGPNSLVGEVGILCDVPRTATILATTHLIALRISKDIFFQMIKDFPTFSIEIMRELAHRLEQTNILLSRNGNSD
ncbi:MAG: cyclic nucleotide-binding domain-containing protein [Alphaproteobacteria bacterium]|nr:cyclic nucleotide-binding domain-containing protein [Alphaproteobacteria bacterium]